MAQHLANEIDKLKGLMSEMCLLVEENTKNAVMSVIDNDKDLAQRVIDFDRQIDKKEIALEEECLKILALYQPVAIDLRYVIACLKMNNELERIGDLSANIAKSAIMICDLTGERKFEHERLRKMMEKTLAMVKNSLDALFNIDEALAVDVCKSDDAVDDLNKEIHASVLGKIKENPENADLLLRILSVSRVLERIADLATNIAEDILYMATGRILRHEGGVLLFAEEESLG
jgi:phosphate transport system protein